MTGFGRTGRWFGGDHWGLRPDILVAAKGATSGYWPFGFAAASGPVYETVAAGGFVHGFTFSHSAVGAAVAREVLRILRDEDLVAASAAKGERLAGRSSGERLGEHPARRRHPGPGADGRRRARSRPGDDGSLPAGRATHGGGRGRVAGARVSSSTPGTGAANGIDGDTLLLGPPFVTTDDELVAIADGVAGAVDAATAGGGRGPVGRGARPGARGLRPVPSGPYGGPGGGSRGGAPRPRSAPGPAARSGRRGSGTPGSSRPGRPSRRRSRARRRPTPASGPPRRGVIRTRAMRRSPIPAPSVPQPADGRPATSATRRAAPNPASTTPAWTAHAPARPARCQATSVPPRIASASEPRSEIPGTNSASTR